MRHGDPPPGASPPRTSLRTRTTTRSRPRVWNRSPRAETRANVTALDPESGPALQPGRSEVRGTPYRFQATRGRLATLSCYRTIAVAVKAEIRRSVLRRAERAVDDRPRRGCSATR